MGSCPRLMCHRFICSRSVRSWCEFGWACSRLMWMDGRRWVGWYGRMAGSNDASRCPPVLPSSFRWPCLAASPSRKNKCLFAWSARTHVRESVLMHGTACLSDTILNRGRNVFSVLHTAFNSWVNVSDAVYS